MKKPMPIKIRWITADNLTCTEDALILYRHPSLRRPVVRALSVSPTSVETVAPWDSSHSLCREYQWYDTYVERFGRKTYLVHEYKEYVR